MTKHNTPALRFGEYSQPWVEVKNNRIFAPTDERGFAGLPVLSATQKDGFIPRSMLGKEISYNKDAEKTYKRVVPDDFAIHLRSFQGGFAHSKYEGITSSAYTTFRLRQASRHDGRFWKYFFSSPLFIQSLTKVTYGIRDGRSIGAEEYFLEESCFPPNREEQCAIGELFSDLDALIEQRRAKHANLQQTKTALLQRMFPQDGADEPELRLGGFSGAWERQPFSDLVAYRGHNSLSRADLTDVPTSAMNIHYGDILVKYDSVVDVSQADLPFVRDVERIANISRQSLSDGDVLFADAAEDSTVGKCVEVQGISDKLVLAGLHTISARPIKSFSPGFLGHALNAPSFHNQLLSKMQGAKVSSISISTLVETVLSFPTLEEQRAIGEVFSNLDALIAAENRYITQLAQAKTALLQRMFV